MIVPPDKVPALLKVLFTVIVELASAVIFPAFLKSLTVIVIVELSITPLLSNVPMVKFFAKVELVMVPSFLNV